MRFIYSLARELHMTVRQLLGNMNQKELCNWIAYFHIENEEYAKEKENRQEQAKSSKVTINQMPDKDSQLQKDRQMMMQLLALSGQVEK